MDKSVTVHAVATRGTLEAEFGGKRVKTYRLGYVKNGYIKWAKDSDGNSVSFLCHQT